MGRWLRYGEILKKVLFGRNACSVERSSPGPLANATTVHSRFRYRKVEHFRAVISRRIDDDVGSEIPDRPFDGIVDGHQIQPRSGFVFSGDSVFEMGDVPRDGSRIRNEYPVAPVFEIEHFRVVAVRTGSGKRKVVLEPSDGSGRTGTIVRIDAHQFAGLGEGGGVEFYHFERERTVDVESQVSGGSRRDFRVDRIRIVRIALDVGVGFGVGPKRGVPSGIGAYHADGGFSRVGVVVGISGRIRYRSGRSGSEIVGIQISVDFRIRAGDDRGKDLSLRIGELPRKRESGTREVDVHRIDVGSGQKGRIVRRIVEPERNSRGRNPFAVQTAAFDLGDGGNRFRRTSVDRSAEGYGSRASARGLEAPSVGIERRGPSESQIRLGGKVASHLRIVPLETQVLQKHLGLGQENVPERHREKREEDRVRENVSTSGEDLAHLQNDIESRRILRE